MLARRPSRGGLPSAERDEEPGGEAEDNTERAEDHLLAHGMDLEVEGRDDLGRRDAGPGAANGSGGRAAAPGGRRPPTRRQQWRLPADGSHQSGKPFRRGKKEADQRGKSCDEKRGPSLDGRTRRRPPRPLLCRLPSHADPRGTRSDEAPWPVPGRIEARTPRRPAPRRRGGPRRA
jgi:hypothetical protein